MRGGAGGEGQGLWLATKGGNADALLPTKQHSKTLKPQNTPFPSYHGKAIKRIETLERDPRVPKLLDVAEDYKAFKQSISDKSLSADMRLDAFNSRLNTLDAKVGRE